MRASIILVTYNGAGYLEACLESVLKEVGIEDEIIVVDNASSDTSVHLVQERWPQVRLIQNETNCGFAVACNQGAAAAQGDALVFLNQDTQVQPDWLKALVEGLCPEEKIGLTTSKLMLMSQPDKINLCGQNLHYTGLSFGHGALEAADDFPQAETVGAVAGASFAIQRALWEHLGGFDPEFFMYYEETDLSWRAALHGYMSWYIPGSTAYHDAAPKPSPRATYYSVRNRSILLLRHWTWLTLFLILPALVMTELVEWAYLTRLGLRYTATKLKAISWLLGHPRQILNARRRAQVRRRVSDAQLLLQCTHALEPKVLSIGVIENYLIRLANALYAMNYRIALQLAQRLKY